MDRVHFPILNVGVDVTVDVDERRNRARKWPKSRTCMSETKVCLGLTSSMPISALSSLSQPQRVLSPSCQAATRHFLTSSDERLSVPVNIAEGVGRTSVADRRRYYAIARGSAMECAAILDACRVLSVASPIRLAAGRSLLLRIVQMLRKLCR